ncbi:hypothetical protein PFY12_13820 [Chryseobacterium camelliae]|uniref:Uncharacterized protein n=1 Tax=Chryseobacterium camelliae TaxID=1265445 RepID=A0ABY7QKA8_9FLAO|nr:hypothetical protein [Chryseobacterium camelliae]WBV60108.1 hypothetical protein PFY12_13820 [Chryseobacterium camelliae]
MKKIMLILSLLSFSLHFSQIAIGKNSVSNSSISLEFAVGNRGLILPWVTSAASVTGAENGTIIYDIADKKVKYFRSGSWIDLSINTTGVVNTVLQNSKTEQTNSKVIIGNNGTTNSTPGILVLSDNDKAMVLPKLDNPHLNIVNPAAGMIAYDTANHQLAIYNGSVWSFWKP